MKEIRREENPWGWEILLVRTERYAGKILHIRAGQRLSLQHHRLKDETLFLLDGDAELQLTATGRPRCRRMARDHSYQVRPGEKHRLIAYTDARVLEIS